MRAHGRRAGAACLAVCLAPGPWHASASAGAGSGKVDEVIEELLLGRIVYPQDALELQITTELGGGRAGDETFADAELEVELGLTDRLQLAAEVPLAWRSTELMRQAGLGNASLGVLYNPLSDRARGLALSAGLELAFPAPPPIGADAWGVEAFAVAYKALGPVHVNLTLGAELELPTGDGAERDGAEHAGAEHAGAEHDVSLAGSLAVLAPLGRWVPVLELRAGGGEGPAAALSAGALWHPAQDLELGAAVQVGLEPRSIGGLVIATVELELAED